MPDQTFDTPGLMDYSNPEYANYHRKTNSTGILDIKTIKHKALTKTTSNESRDSTSSGPRNPKSVRNHSVKQFQRNSAANISLAYSSPRSTRLKPNFSTTSTNSNVSRKLSFPKNSNLAYPSAIPENFPYPAQGPHCIYPGYNVNQGIIPNGNIQNQPFIPPPAMPMRIEYKPEGDSSKGCNSSESIQIGSKIFQLIGAF